MSRPRLWLAIGSLAWGPATAWGQAPLACPEPLLPQGADLVPTCLLCPGDEAWTRDNAADGPSSGAPLWCGGTSIENDAYWAFYSDGSFGGFEVTVPSCDNGVGLQAVVLAESGAGVPGLCRNDAIVPGVTERLAMPAGHRPGFYLLGLDGYAGAVCEASVRALTPLQRPPIDLYPPQVSVSPGGLEVMYPSAGALAALCPAGAQNGDCQYADSLTADPPALGDIRGDALGNLAATVCTVADVPGGPLRVTFSRKRTLRDAAPGASCADTLPDLPVVSHFRDLTPRPPGLRAVLPCGTDRVAHVLAPGARHEYVVGDARPGLYRVSAAGYPATGTWAERATPALASGTLVHVDLLDASSGRTVTLRTDPALGADWLRDAAVEIADTSGAALRIRVRNPLPYPVEFAVERIGGGGPPAYPLRGDTLVLCAADSLTAGTVSTASVGQLSAVFGRPLLGVPRVWHVVVDTDTVGTLTAAESAARLVGWADSLGVALSLASVDDTRLPYAASFELHAYLPVDSVVVAAGCAGALGVPVVVRVERRLATTVLSDIALDSSGRAVVFAGVSGGEDTVAAAGMYELIQGCTRYRQTVLEPLGGLTVDLGAVDVCRGACATTDAGAVVACAEGAFDVVAADGIRYLGSLAYLPDDSVRVTDVRYVCDAPGTSYTALVSYASSTPEVLLGVQPASGGSALAGPYPSGQRVTLALSNLGGCPDTVAVTLEHACGTSGAEDGGVVAGWRAWRGPGGALHVAGLPNGAQVAVFELDGRVLKTWATTRGDHWAATVPAATRAIAVAVRVGTATATRLVP